MSVIIPAYNSAKFLAESIRSVLDQTFQDFELIVVDDGSTDNTHEIVSDFASPKIKYLYQKNQGPPTARNAGIRASAGRYIAFLDADDLWLPAKLEYQLKAFRESPRTGVVFCDMHLWISEKSAIFGRPYLQRCVRPLPRGRVLDELLIRFFGHPSTLLVRKEVFDRIGLFDEKLRYCDDYDMLFRLATQFEFEVVPTPLVKYRLHTRQISRNLEPFLQGHIILYHKTLQSPEFNARARKKLSASLADIHFQYAILLARQGKLKPGFFQLQESWRVDAGRFLPDTFSLFQRALSYLGRMLNPRPKGEELRVIN